MSDLSSPWEEYLAKFHEYIDEILTDDRLDRDEQIRIIYAIISGLEGMIMVMQGERMVH